MTQEVLLALAMSYGENAKHGGCATAVVEYLVTEESARTLSGAFPELRDFHQDPQPSKLAFEDI